MIEVKLIKDSISDKGARLTTFVLTYPRFIHAEFMTHRMFSRNASSSRAIPVKKQIQMVIDNPAIPIAFTKNQKGMQGGEVIDDEDAARDIWLAARDWAVESAWHLVDLDVHKQYANRILEPFSHITVVCSATDYNNFFALRVHPAAQPEICELARQMWELYKNNKPDELRYGEWHLPFITSDDYSDHVSMFAKTIGETEQSLNVKRSVARCARVSYLNHEGTTPTIEQDIQLYDRLLGSVPIHASPAEHQAMASFMATERSGNFTGWTQYRKLLANENIETFTGPPDEN